MTTPARKPFPQFNDFRPFIINELTRRKSLPNVGSPEVGMPFARFTSALQSKKADGSLNYQFFSMGLNSVIESPAQNLFNLTYGSADVLGYATNTSNVRIPITTDNMPGEVNPVRAGGAHPVPGITSIHYDQYNSNSALKCDVAWSCYDDSQLEFLRPHFMTPGIFVIIEWGQIFSHQLSNTLPYKTLDFKDPDIINKLVNYYNKGHSAVIDDYVDPSNGNYDFIVGMVGNFDFSQDSANRMDVVTTIYGVSETIFGIDSQITAASTDPSEEQLTVHEFFNLNQKSQYWNLIATELHNPNTTKIFVPHTDVIDNTAAEGQAGNTGNLSAPVDNTDTLVTAVNQYDQEIFISWEFFINTILNGPTGLLSIFNPWIYRNIKSIKDVLYVQEEGSPIKYNDPFEPYIGNSIHLQTIRPETMIVVNQNTTQNKKPQSTLDVDIRKNGEFVDILANPSTGLNELHSRGKLSRGVWLNIKKISECFLTTANFIDGLEKLLNELSAATANFWDLRLYYEDQFGAYVIVDRHHIEYPNKTWNNTPSDVNKYYMFNVGMQSELLGINLKSNLSQLEASQIAIMVGSNQTQDTALKADQSLVTLSSLQALNMVDLVRTHQPSAVHNDALMKFVRNDPRFAQNLINVTGGTNQSPKAGVEEGNIMLASPINTQTPATQAASNKPTVNNSINTGITPVQGLDIFAASGQTVNASADGIAHTTSLTIPTYQADGTSTNLQIAGLVSSPFYGDNYSVAIYHNGGQLITVYRGMNKPTIQDGALVKKGQPIGTLALPATRIINDSSVTQAHLQFEVYKRNGEIWQSQAPEAYIDLTTSNLSPDQVKQTVTNPHAAQDLIMQTPAPSGIPAQGTPAAKLLEQSAKDASLAASRAQELSDTYHFNNELIDGYVTLVPSQMIHDFLLEATQASHTKSGRRSTPYYAPIPTQQTLNLKLPGLSGISITDAFQVAKIPKVYNNLGLFMTVGISHDIDTSGWYTNIRSVFVFLGEDQQ